MSEETVWETTRLRKKVNITDAVFAIADSLMSVSTSIDELARETRTDRVAEALENVSSSIENGLREISNTMEAR